MGLALYSPCAYPLIKQGFRRASSANHLPDLPSLSFTLQNSSFEQSLSVSTINGVRRIRLSKKGSFCCNKPSDRRTSNQEEIISLLKRIQSSISKGESRVVREKENSDESSENKSLTKAVLDVLEKQRKKTEVGGDTDVQEPPKRQAKVPRPASSFAKKTPIPSASGPRGKLRESNNNEALGEMTEKEEKASLIETMKLAELKEVAKNRGIKGYSKLKKSQLLELLRSS